MRKIIVAPSILSADFVNLEKDIKKVEDAGCDWLHIDVMDGHFVPNITIGIPVVKAIKEVTKLPLDVHLMISKPEKYVKDFANAGADIITVHYEACKGDIKEVLQKISSLGVKAGVSIKPASDAEVLDEAIPFADLILVMSVEPGFGGQEFMHDSIIKIAEIKELAAKHGKNDIIIEVDGGINDKTAKLVVDAGANALVAGSYIYKATDFKQAIDALR